MNIIVGLGNPGDIYQFSRHNAGFMVLDNLSSVLECPDFTNEKKVSARICKNQTSLFIKPETFMNESGKAVRAVLDYYFSDLDKTSGYKNLYILHDDLDLELGSYKIQYGIGPKGHNGLLSVYQYLGTSNFWHVRIGVDSRMGDRSMPPQAYVLQRFTPEQLEKFYQVRIEIVKELLARISNV